MDTVLYVWPSRESVRFPIEPGMTTLLEEATFTLLLDFAELLDEDFAKLLLNFTELSPSFKLFADFDESSPQAIRNNASKEGIRNFTTSYFQYFRMIFFITNIAFSH